MSQMITKRVWDHSQARGPAHHVLLAIADRADDEGVAWPSMGDISRRCRIGVATVQRAVSKLIEIKELEVSEGGAGKRSNRYVVLTGRDQKDSVAFRNGTQDDEASVPERNEKTRRTPERNTNANGSCSGAEHKSSSHSAPSNEPTNVGRQASQHSLRPAWTQPLIDQLAMKGIAVSWARMSDLKWVQLQQLIRSHGEPYLIHLAAGRWNPNKPIKFGTLLIDIWQDYAPPPPGSPWHPDTVAARNRPSGSSAKPPHCGDVDCDPISRTREVRDENGIPSLAACPACHPSRKERAA